jgi:septum formation protein
LIKMEIVLASASPRRIDLMRLLDLPFTTLPTGADEALPPEILPEQAVKTLALRKARAAAQRKGQALVIGADTVVAAEGQLLGKPADRADAARMLRLLSGSTHQVYTGIALVGPDGEETFCRRTDVRFYPLDEREIAWYLDTGEPFDKAGAYGIQGKGAMLVEEISGDYFNVVGFPVSLLAKKLKRRLERIAFEQVY